MRRARFDVDTSRNLLAPRRFEAAPRLFCRLVQAIFVRDRAVFVDVADDTWFTLLHAPQYESLLVRAHVRRTVLPRTHSARHGQLTDRLVLSFAHGAARLLVNNNASFASCMRGVNVRLDELSRGAEARGDGRGWSWRFTYMSGSRLRYGELTFTGPQQLSVRVADINDVHRYTLMIDRRCYDTSSGTCTELRMRFFMPSRDDSNVLHGALGYLLRERMAPVVAAKCAKNYKDAPELQRLVPFNVSQLIGGEPFAFLVPDE